MTRALPQLVRAIACAVLALAPALGAAATSEPSRETIVNEQWIEVENERLVLPDGTIQIRVRRARAGTPDPRAAAKGAPTAGANTVPAAAATAAGGTAAAAAPAADATAIADPTSAQLKKMLAVDLSVPASPAMSVLSMGGTDVQRPAFARDLAMAVVRGFDKDGRPGQAFAVDAVPLALFAPHRINGGLRYQHDKLMQILARTTVSLAAGQVEGDKQASQMAAGVRVGLYDAGDLGLFWRERDACLARLLQTLQPVPGRDMEPPKELIEVIKKAEETCKVGDLWAKPALYAGFAQAWYSHDGRLSQARGSARALWASYSIGLNERVDKAALSEENTALRALLQLHAARKTGERVKLSDSADTLTQEDRNELIARLRVGKEKWHAFLDAGVSRVRTAGFARENVRRIGLGVEYQLREDLWLVASSVTERGFATGDRQLISTGLRFGQVPEALFDPAPPKK